MPIIWMENSSTGQRLYCDPTQVEDLKRKGFSVAEDQSSETPAKSANKVPDMADLTGKKMVKASVEVHPTLAEITSGVVTTSRLATEVDETPDPEKEDKKDTPDPEKEDKKDTPDPEKEDKKESVPEGKIVKK